MKRKLDPSKLVLETNTITILTQHQFELIRGGGRGGGDIEHLAAKKTRGC